MKEMLIFVLAGVAGTVGYGMMSRCAPRELLFSTLGSFLMTALYGVLTLTTSMELLAVSLLSASVAGIYAALMARFLRCPATVLLTLQLVVLVPGRYLYETVFSYITREYTKAFESLRCTMDVAIGIAAGIILAGLLDYALVHFWRQMEARKLQSLMQSGQEQDSTGVDNMTHFMDGKGQ